LFNILFNNKLKISFILDKILFYDISLYIVIITYFINAEYKNYKVIINFKYIKWKYINKKLTDVLTKVVYKYKIKYRIYIIISDNTSNN
jgi:hypothetical protein